jgi:23S rRNA pseudouridine1911/1915/1917 synthase
LKIEVNPQDIDTGKRLDLYITLKLPAYSRSSIKKTIEENKVKVNGEVCYKAGYKVRIGDVIDFPELEYDLSNKFKELPKSPFDLEILFEDEDYIFINKPVGLIVHPTHPGQNHTLVNKLLSLRDSLPQTNILRPGIVHRLDKDTSGVIVIAKTPKALWWVTGQFAERKVKKQYISIGLNSDSVFKYKKGEVFEFESNIERSRRERKQYLSLPLTKNDQSRGRYSKTKFEILEVLQLSSGKYLVYTKVSPLTGRTHQIRVHQRALNFPILGDPIYLSSKEFKYSEDIFNFLDVNSRLCLHAQSVTFENYNGKVYSISAQVPKELRSLIDNAKENSEQQKYT